MRRRASVPGRRIVVLASRLVRQDAARRLPSTASAVLTSDDAIRLDQLPTSAIVLGGGVIGVEFASAWRSFGVEVTVVEALPRLRARRGRRRCRAACDARSASAGSRVRHRQPGAIGEPPTGGPACS